MVADIQLVQQDVWIIFWGAPSQRAILQHFILHGVTLCQMGDSTYSCWAPRNSHQLVSDCSPQFGIIQKLGESRWFVFFLDDAASCADCAVFSVSENHR